MSCLSRVMTTNQSARRNWIGAVDESVNYAKIRREKLTCSDSFVQQSEIMRQLYCRHASALSYISSCKFCYDEASLRRETCVCSAVFHSCVRAETSAVESKCSGASHKCYFSCSCSSDVQFLFNKNHMKYIKKKISAGTHIREAFSRWLDRWNNFLIHKW